MRKSLILCLMWACFLQQQLSAKIVSILHTNDWQSRLLGFPNYDYQQNPYKKGTRGGVARLASLIDQRKSELERRGPVLVLDSGDFTMGSLFHTISRESGGELRLLSSLGYDAITFGNHEFDFRPKGLAQMIESALKYRKKIPSIVSTNILFSENHDGDRALKKLMTEGMIKRHLIIESEGIRVAVLGALGKDASEVATGKYPVTFEDPIESLNRELKKIRQGPKVDLIILLSHCGLNQKEGVFEGEEIDIAQETDGLDIIIGGHSHSALKRPLVVNNTIIVQAGSNTKFLGELIIDSDMPTKILDYHLHPIDHKISPKKSVEKTVSTLKAVVSRNFLEKHRLIFDQPIVKLEETVLRTSKNHFLGRLIAEVFREQTQSDIGFIPQGSIRDDLIKSESGILTISDLFRLAPLGIGEHDENPGYPLIKISATSREIKSILEVLLLAPRIKGRSYDPNFSGLTFSYSPYRAPLDQIIDIKIGNKTVDLRDHEKLYTIAATSYVGRFIGMISDLSGGVYDYSLKNSLGQKIANIGDAVVKESGSNKKHSEVKAWAAVIRFFSKKKKQGTESVPFFPISDKNAAPFIIAKKDLSFYNLTHGSIWIQKVFLVICVVLIFIVFSLGAVLIAKRAGHNATHRSATKS